MRSCFGSQRLAKQLDIYTIGIASVIQPNLSESWISWVHMGMATAHAHPIMQLWVLH